jgi:hypothetical protein
MRVCLLVLLAVCACAADPWDRLADASRKPAAEARSALEQLVLENPAFHAARFNLGTLLLDSDPAKAAEQLELATAATSTSLAADAWHNLALARFAQGRLEDALRAAEQAATRDPAAVALRDEIRRVVLVRQDEARRKAEEEAKKLHLAPQPLPVGRVGERYEAQLPIRGGTPPATATLAGDSKLPAGLSLSRDGVLSGTPHAAGDTRLELALADSATASVNAHVDLRILPAPAITTATLPEVVIRQTYTVRLEAVGLDAPLRWSVANLPDGLTASADGTISGSTTVTGTRTLHVHVEDGTRQANRMLELTVTDLFAPAEDPLPPATAGAAYRHRGTVRGPVQEYRWAAGADAPLNVNADGTISGTPAQPGDLTLPLRLSAADGRTREMAIHLPVNPRPLIQTEPVQVTVGTPLDRPLSVTGGTAPFAWSVASGALPAGLRLDADGHLRGVAKDPGTSTVTVAVEDHWKAATQAEIQITSAPSSNPPPDQDKDKDKQDQAKDDKQQQGKDDKQQQGKDDKQQQGKDDKQQQGKDDKQQQGKDDKQQGKDGKQPGDQGKQQEQQQAAMLNQTAADRWLDQLPDEDRDVLRYQLLDGGQVKPAQPKGPQW